VISGQQGEMVQTFERHGNRPPIGYGVLLEGIIAKSNNMYLDVGQLLQKIFILNLEEKKNR
tara:strand:- start:538 stop:720 length:183 start_codon:yes stop_codon:yes gene_type:complete